MEANNNIYRNKINSYLLQLNEANIQDASSVLMWFYRIKDANIMFETYEVSDYVYNRLRNNGYDEIHESEEEKGVILLINGSSENVNKNTIARRIISVILRKLKKHESLDLALLSLVEMFNERFNRDVVFSYMMDRLHESVGLRVTFNAIRDGKFCLITGVLDEVDDYKSITVDGIKYPFIDINTGINRIATISGNVLFNNGSLNTRVNLSDVEEVKKLGEEIFMDKYRQELPKVI